MFFYMKKFNSTYLLIFIILIFTGCTTRQCQSCKRANQFSERDYEVFMYSGDSLVFHDKFHGVINQEDSSDGIYYFKGDTLIEVGGNYLIKSEK